MVLWGTKLTNDHDDSDEGSEDLDDSEEDTRRRVREDLWQHFRMHVWSRCHRETNDGGVKEKLYMYTLYAAIIDAE
ncbi:hypothetical protein E1B28_005177 [Marasmius oreades]|uniref:Uncharacterized protein n=1 Tax=Marasmius oreades TaxID=181124 RepID=A0A9P7V0B4_9AGAR|nr:uncharacterized protein E1B28_005177 [Marasmius oreades]KAG7097865.1 hypothetical protein E1B28_005177 [Marasmius oreades]